MRSSYSRISNIELAESLLPVAAEQQDGEAQVSIPIRENHFTYASAKQAEGKIKLCIAILESQICKRQLPRIAYFATAISTVMSSAAHITNSVLTFNDSINQYGSTMYTPNCYQPPQYHFSVNCNSEDLGTSLEGEFANYRICYDSHISLSNWCTVSALKDLQQQFVSNCTLPCSNAIDHILSGPGMWNGYLWTIATLGLGVPAALVLVESAAKNIKKYVNNSSLNKLSPEKMRTIQHYADEYQIHFSANASLEEMISCFKERLANMKEDAVYRAAVAENLNALYPRSTVRYVNGLIAVSTESSSFEANAKTSGPSDVLFQYAEIAVDRAQYRDARQHRQAFMDANAAKATNAVPARTQFAQRFFSRLHTEAPVQKKAIMQNIFEFANIHAKVR